MVKTYKFIRNLKPLNEIRDKKRMTALKNKIIGWSFHPETARFFEKQTAIRQHFFMGPCFRSMRDI